MNNVKTSFKLQHNDQQGNITDVYFSFRAIRS